MSKGPSVLVLSLVCLLSFVGPRDCQALTDASSCTVLRGAVSADLVAPSLEYLGEEEEDESAQLQLGRSAIRRLKASAKSEDATKAQASSALERHDLLQMLNGIQVHEHGLNLRSFRLMHLGGSAQVPGLREMALLLLALLLVIGPFICFVWCLKPPPPRNAYRPGGMQAGKWMVLSDKPPFRVAYAGFDFRQDAVEFFKSGPGDKNRILFAPLPDGGHTEISSFGPDPRTKDSIRICSQRKVSEMIEGYFMVVIHTGIAGGDFSLFPFTSEHAGRTFLNTLDLASGILYDFDQEEIYAKHGQDPVNLHAVRRFVHPRCNSLC